MEGNGWKKVLLVVVACVAALTLVVGIAVAVTTTGHGENGEHAETCECDGDCSECDEEGEDHEHGEAKGGGNGTLQPYWEEAINEVAGLLGLSEEELHEEKEGGKTLAQIAGEKGISTDQVVNTITEKVGELVDAEVAAGNVTPEQAEKIKSVAAMKAPAYVESGHGHGMGSGGGSTHDHNHQESCD